MNNLLLKLARFVLNVIKLQQSSAEMKYLTQLSSALENNNPYNATNLVLKEMDKAIKAAFLSVFKTNMQPLRNEIVKLMKQYNSEKEEHVRHFGKGL